MNIDKNLLEFRGGRHKRGFRSLALSALVHASLLGAAVGLSMSTTREVAAEEKPIPVFIETAAAAAPPPPPPPAAAPSVARASEPPVTVTEPVSQPEFTQPTEVPDELPVTEAIEHPDVEPLPVESGVPTSPAASGPGSPGGVAGGVEGGELGGVQGGVVGGVIGGVVGGQVGGVPGGSLDGVPGGTGDSGGDASAIPSGPVRVGGNVKAPIIVRRFDPEYTETARKGRVSGIVIVEAIIDRHGNVDRVKVVKGLPLGLSDSAVQAVKKWKFKPGTLAGQPIDVIFNLTVNFELGGDPTGGGE